MENWLLLQRARTAQAHRLQENVIEAYIPPPPPTPPPSQRQAKIQAIHSIKMTGTRNKMPKIPQIEGAEQTPDSSISTEKHYLSPEVPHSPHHHQQEEYSEGDLESSYQRQLEDSYEWDHVDLHLSFWEQQESSQYLQYFDEESECELYSNYYVPSFNGPPQRRHTFNGFVLPTTFKRPRPATL
jgi:hypothetical protein